MVGFRAHSPTGDGVSVPVVPGVFFCLVNSHFMARPPEPRASPLFVHVPTELDAAVRAYAVANDLRLGQVVRRALREHLNASPLCRCGGGQLFHEASGQ